jgi:hypothetical protein
MREGRWVIADLRDKDDRIRAVAIPVWVRKGIDRLDVSGRTGAGAAVALHPQGLPDRRGVERLASAVT